MRHIRLEAERFRSIYRFQKLKHTLPAMHSSPADLAFGSEALAMILCDRACGAKRLRDLLRVFGRALSPLRRADRGIDPHDPISPDSQIAQLLCDDASLPHLSEELLPIFIAAHRRSAASWRPN